eukprot:2916977-Amphidinium_carterae.1
MSRSPSLQNAQDATPLSCRSKPGQHNIAFLCVSVPLSAYACSNSIGCGRHRISASSCGQSRHTCQTATLAATERRFEKGRRTNSEQRHL